MADPYTIGAGSTPAVYRR